MHTEIISLLSSSPHGPPLSSPSTPLLPRSASPVADCDVFDVTTDSQGAAEDALPNSGRRTRSPKRQIDNQLYPRCNFAFPTDSRDARSSPALPDHAHDGVVLVETPGNKRKRVSSPLLSRQVVAGETNWRPRPQRVDAQLDLIEVISSPEPATKAPLRRVFEEDWDPFVSSPRCPWPSKSKTTAAPPVGATLSEQLAKTSRVSDPLFANLGPPTGRQEARQHVTKVDDPLDSDPFESPPPRPDLQRCPPARKDWDPISSSATDANVTDKNPYTLQAPSRISRQAEIIDLDVDSDHVSAPASGSDPASDDEDELPDLEKFDFNKHRRQVSDLTYFQKRGDGTRSKHSASASSTQGLKKTAEKRRKEQQQKTAERESKTASKEADRERRRVEKEEAKANRAKQKERAAALAEVNKLRTDKKVSAPEMIVDIPTTLPSPLITQIDVILKDLGIEHNSWTSPVNNVITWRRKVTSRYNEELDRWEPTPLQIQHENFSLVIMSAAEFVDIALGRAGLDMEAHVTKMKRHFPTSQLIYLIEGLDPYLRKGRTAKNRQFISAVRNQDGGPSATAVLSETAARRKKKDTAPPADISEDDVQNVLVDLQVLHGALIHQTNVQLETAQWIGIFTQHISTVPYRRQRDEANAAGFCMETGQVRTGDTVQDTYVKLLQEINRVTAPIAHGIAAEFTSVCQLVTGLEVGGPLVLETCRKATNRDGSFSDQRVGQAMSKRLHKVFTSQDEHSTDI